MFLDDDPFRCLLIHDSSSEMSAELWQIRNSLKQKLGIVEQFSEVRSDFHLSIDRVCDAIEGEPILQS